MPKPRRKPAALPIEPPQKPTPEAMAHGDYTQGSSGTRSVWTNLSPTMMADLHLRGLINKRHAAAGLCFTETYHAVWGTPSNRDPLDMGPRGGTVHETDGQAERMAKKRARLNTILNRVGPRLYSMLVSVAVFDENPREISSLERALEECAVAYGVED